jgi:hypothetical protein
MRQMFIEGVSTRPVGNVLECLCGERLSASKVSSVVKELDEQVREYYHRSLADDYLFLFLDGLTVKIRMELKVKKFLILCMSSNQFGHTVLKVSIRFERWQSFFGRASSSVLGFVL